MTLDPAKLSQAFSPIAAREIVAHLGQAAGFLLNDQALAFRQPQQDRPSLPQVVGGCWPVFAVRDERWRQYTLPAFVLPLQWLSGKPDDRRLPAELLRVAGQVRDDFSVQQQDFGLSFNQPFQAWPDLSRFTREHLEADSCYAALALGLYSAQSQVPANPQVWASAVWNRYFSKVTCLAEKLMIAQRWGATKFFVAPEQVDQGKSLAEESVEVLELGRSIVDRPAEAMSNCFAHSLLEPDSSNWEDCRRFHDLLREVSREKGTEYYARVLIDHIASRCRQRLRVSESCANLGPVRQLVTIATRYTAPILLLAKTLQVEQVLVLYTQGEGDFKAEAKKVVKLFNQYDSQCKVVSMPFQFNSQDVEFPGSFVTSLRGAVLNWSEYTPDHTTAFDIDRGLTMHKVALLERVIAPENTLVTLSHQAGAENTIDHGSEQVLLWQMKEGLAANFREVSEIHASSFN